VWMVGLTLVLSVAPATVFAQNIDQLFQQANAAQSAKRFSEAETILRQAIQRDPQNAEAYRKLCDVLDDQDKIDAAVSACRKAVEINPTSARSYFLLGYVLQKQKKPDEAIVAYRTAIKLDPNYANAYNGLGAVLYDQKKLDEAIVAFRTAIKLDPNYANAYNGLGAVLRDQKKLDEAIVAFRKALSLAEDTSGSPTTAHTLAHNNLGLVFQEQGKLEDAIREFEQAAKLDPNYSFARNNLEEARRQLALRRNPQTLALAETRYLPQDAETPLRRAVVKVIAFFPGSSRGTSIGTGSIIKQQNGIAWVLTNRHVVFEPDTRQRGENLQIEPYFGSLPKQIVRPRLGEKGLGSVRILHMTDPEDPLDLALLEVIGLPLDIKSLPLGVGIEDNAVTQIIGNSDSDLPTNNAKLIDADEDILTLKIKLDDGNSGSPVMLNKQMVGLVYSATTVKGSQQPRGNSYAYPMPRIIQKLNEWGVRLP
ncbi:MAG: tetratricopeptide repeat protein, partial [Phormidesmis sp. CAN_BIN44]|nr:tetratricopeptide repeat protein [Phormidesmis sp. CAN_BIN44]